MPKNLFVSVMRTLVPVVVGLLLGLAARVGLDLDDATVATQVTAALTAGYYAAFRLLEALAERLDWEPLRLVAGVLLGWARPPEYEAMPQVAGVRLKLDSASFSKDLGDALERAARDRGGA